MSKIAEPRFITIAANGMQPESESSSAYDAEESATSTPLPRTHDTSRTGYHIKHLMNFSTQLNEAARGAFPNKNLDRNRYKDAEVVLIRWKDDSRLGVSCELEDLNKVFETGYGFKTTTWLIPTEDPLEDIMSKSLCLIREAGKEGKLLVVYYAGHAAMNEDRQQVWFRTGRPRDGFLEWFAIQQLFLKAKADVLFLLDCCAAASATTKPQFVSGLKETIGACGFESQAPEPGSHSFTCELIEMLDKWKNRAAFSVAMLHSELLANLRHPKPKKDMFGKLVESRRTPVYVVTTSNTRAVSIELGRRPGERDDRAEDYRPRKRPRVSPQSSSTTGDDFEESILSAPTHSFLACGSTSADTDSQRDQSDGGKYAEDQLNRVLPDGDLSIPHVLISLALEGEQLLEIGAWKKWLEDCPLFAKYAKIEGLYRSHSSLLILSLPVVIWDLLPDNQACSFIGYVNSTNHVREGVCQGSQDSESWLSSGGEWENDGEGLSSGRSSISQPNTSHDENSSHSPELPHLATRLATQSTLPIRQHIVHTEPTSKSTSVAPCGGYQPSGDSEASFQEIQLSEHRGTKEGQNISQIMVPSDCDSQNLPLVQHLGTSAEGNSIFNLKPPSQTGNVMEEAPSSIYCADSIIQPNEEDLSPESQRLNLQSSHQRLGGIDVKFECNSSEYSTTTPGQDEYIYSRLRESQGDFRLIELQPGHMSDPIRITLINASLSEPPSYEALSYVWGDPQDVYPIYVNERRFFIRHNLTSALNSLQLADTTRILWVDAICINQADLHERSTQVRIMGDIYKYASKVLVWLGSDTESSRTTFEYLNQNRARLLQESADHTPRLEIPDPIWKALTLDVFARSYWSRLWIVQELILAPQIQVFCGSSTVDGDLLLAMRKLGPRQYHCPYPLSLQQPMENLHAKLALSYLKSLGWFRQRRQLNGLKSFSIKELFTNFQKRHCSDPRDMVFGLLGLTDTDEGIIKPDYRKSVSEVYTDFASSYIRTCRQIDIILPRRKRARSDLPSWVPDWSQPFPVGTFDSFCNLYNVAGTSPLSASFSSKPYELYLEGFQFRSIVQVIDAADFMPHQGVDISALSRFVTVARELAFSHSGSQFYPTGEEIQRAVARTLSGDLDWKCERLPLGSTIFDTNTGAGIVPDDSYTHCFIRERQQDVLGNVLLVVLYRMNRELSFMLLSGGYIGLAPRNARPGDLVCIILGSNLPVVLRRKNKRYTLIGSCYVHGIMDGEAMVDFDEGKLKPETIILV